MKGQLLVAQLPVLLEQRAAHHRFRRQAVSSGLLDPVPTQIAGCQTQQRTVFVEPLRDGFQLAADFVLRENFNPTSAVASRRAGNLRASLQP